MAKKKASSPRKPSTKAATPTRSTTSSTTGKTAAKRTRRKKTAEKSDVVENVDRKPVETSSSLLKKSSSPENLSEEQQYNYLTLLSKGASPAVACGQLNIPLSDVIWTIEHDPHFESMIDRVQELLSQNVAAALYRSAMEGSATAQQYYLKNRPPSNWVVTPNADGGSQDELTDDELIESFRTEALALLDELKAKD